jgi:hypothetical protein
VAIGGVHGIDPGDHRVLASRPATPVAHTRLMNPDTRHRHLFGSWALVGALASAVGLLAGGVSSARADCCLSGPSAPADFHARAIPGGPVRLLPVTTIEISSQAPADYTAAVEITVGGRVIARTTARGHVDATWSLLRLPLTRAQRHAVTSVADHEHRRAILGVALRGILEGNTRPTSHLILLTMSVAGERRPAAVKPGATVQITRISLARQLLDTGQALRGRLVIRTPTPLFKRTNRDASPSARFSVGVTSTCQAQVIVAPLALVTRESAVTQVRDSVAGDELLAASSDPKHVWRLAEYQGVSEETGAPDGVNGLYGIAVMPIGRRRWVQAREFAQFTGPCTDPDLRQSVFTAAMKHILSSVTATATILPAAS